MIPEHFSRDLLLGKSPTLAYAGDAAYFLVYGSVVEGLATAGGTLGAKAKVSRMVMSGENIALAAEQHSAMNLTMQPVFNPTMGYINYVVPAVFVLILHQTLLIAVALLGGGQNEHARQGRNGYWLQYPPLRVTLVRACLFMLIYLPLVMYYFGFTFSFYQISRLAAISDLLAVTVPFLLAVIFIGDGYWAVAPKAGTGDSCCPAELDTVDLFCGLYLADICNSGADKYAGATCTGNTCNSCLFEAEPDGSRFSSSRVAVGATMAAGAGVWRDSGDVNAEE